MTILSVHRSVHIAAVKSLCTARYHKVHTVKGLDIFYECFSDFTDQYVLISGAACDLSFHNNDLNFRATKDLDMVLVIEAQTQEFAQRFLGFVQKEKYQNCARSNGSPQFYRFDKPEEALYFSGKELEDGNTLQDYSVQKDSISYFKAKDVDTIIEGPGNITALYGKNFRI